MKPDELFTTTGGFATLGPELTEARARLDATVLAWAREVGARQQVFAPLMSVPALAGFDYFDNFPQLMLLAAPIEPAVLAAGADSARMSATLVRDDQVAPEALAPARWVLPSAACYNVYLDLSQETLSAPRYVTTVATCYRNETHYDGLRRLHAFTMREIVCVGPRETVLAHLAGFKPRILALAARLGLTLDIAAASDPFFQPEGGRGVLQKLFPVKEEFVHGGSLAIASVNFHRNFFGERCRISLDGGEPAYSACVAFGLERWLAALLETHGPDPDHILALLAGADA